MIMLIIKREHALGGSGEIFFLSVSTTPRTEL